ncbi:MAG: DNA alkylation repair protein [Paludibacter sp.]
MNGTQLDDVITELKSLATPEHFAKLAHFGIENSKALGIKIPLLRQLAKKIGVNHDLALELWTTEIHEARILASMIENPKAITEKQFDSWVNDFNSWDLCDQCCGLLVKTPFVLQKIDKYSSADEEFVKRTAFVLMCALVIFDKKVNDDYFNPFLAIIEREAWDERNFVRKAVNWALRQIGKRNETLRLIAIETAERIVNQENKSARWIANDALRELKSAKVIAYVNRKQK